MKGFTRTCLAIAVAVTVAAVVVLIIPSADSDVSVNPLDLCDKDGNIIPSDQPILNGYKVSFDTFRKDGITTFFVPSGTELDMNGTFLRINTEGNFNLDVAFSNVDGFLEDTGIKVLFFDKDGADAGNAELTKDNNFSARNSKKLVDGDYKIKLYTLNDYNQTKIPGKVTGMTMSFTIDGDAETYKITATCTNGGTINPKGTVVVSREDQTFTISPYPTFEIKDVIVDGKSVGAVKSYTFVDVKADHTIHAVFDLIRYPCTVSYDGNGADSGTAPPPETVIRGNDISVASQGNLSKKGYYFGGWNTAADGSGTNWYPGNRMPVYEDITLYAQWKSVKMYTLNVKQGDNGTINPDTVMVEEGSSFTFKITPKDGYRISDVKVDGKSVGAVGSYTFTDIRSDHVIAASYERNDIAVATDVIALSCIAAGSVTAVALIGAVIVKKK